MSEIDHILKLAQLEIEEKKKRELEKEFSSILDFVKKLEELDVSELKSMTHPENIKNVTREDKVDLKSKEEREKTREKLLDLSSQREGKYIKTTQIL